MSAIQIIKEVWLNQGNGILSQEQYKELVKLNGGDTGETALEMAMKAIGKLEAYKEAGRPSWGDFKVWYRNQGLP